MFLVCGGCLATVAMLLVSAMLAQMGILWMLGKSGPLGSNIQDKCTDKDGNGVVLWYAYVTLVTGRVGGEGIWVLGNVAGILGFGRV